MTKEEAIGAISKDFQEKYEDTQMTITLNGKNFKVSIYPCLLYTSYFINLSENTLLSILFTPFLKHALQNEQCIGEKYRCHNFYQLQKKTWRTEAGIR